MRSRAVSRISALIAATVIDWRATRSSVITEVNASRAHSRDCKPSRAPARSSFRSSSSPRSGDRPGSSSAASSARCRRNGRSPIASSSPRWRWRRRQVEGRQAQHRPQGPARRRCSSASPNSASTSTRCISPSGTSPRASSRRCSRLLLIPATLLGWLMLGHKPSRRFAWSSLVAVTGIVLLFVHEINEHPGERAPDRGRHRPDPRRHVRRGDRQRHSGAARNPPLSLVRATCLVDGGGRGDRWHHRLRHDRAADLRSPTELLAWGPLSRACSPRS